MQALKSFGSEMRAILKNKKMLVSFIGILLIPIMYSGMLIGAFWDPYGQLSKLPVAVVNEDAGAVLDGKSIGVGRDLVERLKDNDEFQWDFVSKEAAEAGLNNGEYYLAVEVPDNFSKQAATLMDENPQPASLVYLKNDGSNYLAGKIGDSAIEKLKNEVSAEVTKAYAESVFDSFGQAAEGFREASGGAAELHDGAEQAKDGAELLQRNLAKLADGSLQLESGVTELASGTSELSAGAERLSAGTGGLSDGLAQLQAAADRLHGGAAETAGAGGKLAAGLESARQGEAELAGQAASLADSLAKLAAAAEAEGAAAGSGAAGGAGDGEGADGEAAAGEAAGAPGAAEQAKRLRQLADAAAALAAGADKLAAGGERLAAGGSELQQGQAALQQGAEQLAAKLSEAAASGKQLAAGAEELAAGAAELNAGASRAKQGAATIAAGSEQLESGSSELADGTGRLADGSAELSGKLGDAAKESGETSGSDSLYDMFAKPVDVTERDLAGVPNYGTGFAPYFLSLGLFVGALLSTVVLPLRSQTVPPRSGWSRYVGKTGMVTVVAVLQALIADAILLYGIGLEAKDTGLFVAMSLAASFSFMMIIQLLVTTMDNPGRFIGIIVLILQLTGSAGTYPKELIPDWLQKVGDWLPMTYTIAGFRDIISGGDLSHARRQIVVTLLFALPFMALMLLYFLQEQRKGRASGNGSGGDAPAVRPAEA